MQARLSVVTEQKRRQTGASKQGFGLAFLFLAGASRKRT
jgi:hypothetical protein